MVKSHDLEESARDLVAEYKEWLHSRVGLIPDLDDDVMDEQKVSYCSFVRSSSPLFDFRSKALKSC